MAVSSVTNLNSNSGILISLIGPPLSEAKILNYTKPFLDRDTATIDAPMYCPECFAGLFKSLEEKIRTTTSLPEPLPPIGETSIPRTVYCTENKHKGHGKKDLLHFGAVHYKLNEFRVSLGASPHQAILVNIENKTLSKSLGRWVWIDP